MTGAPAYIEAPMLVLASTSTGKVYYKSSSPANELATIGDIPTVSDATITVNQGGVTKGTFTLNGSATTIDLDAGGSGGGAVDSVNGQTGDVVLDAQDVGALPDSTVIPTVNNPTITFTQGGISKGTITLNQSANQTIALDAGGSGYTAGTGIDITSDTISIDSTVLTTNTAQTVSGKKTFSNGIATDVIQDSGGSRNLISAGTNSLSIGSPNTKLYLYGNTARPTYYHNGNNELALLSDVPTSNNIEAHKAYKATGEVLEDTEGYNDVLSCRNTGFDLSKFTVAGSPTVTDTEIVITLK